MLTEKREHYKPFMYPWAFEAYHTAQKMHWLPDEVPLQEDIDDWNTKLTEQEKNLLTQLFRFFTQADADIAAGYYERYIPAFPHPELRMMLGVFGTAEANHIHAYSLLLDTMGMPETDYQAFHEFEVMKAKHEFLFEQRRRVKLGQAPRHGHGRLLGVRRGDATLLDLRDPALLQGAWVDEGYVHDHRMVTQGRNSPRRVHDQVVPDLCSGEPGDLDGPLQEGTLPDVPRDG
jgi:hypothetical protein